MRVKSTIAGLAALVLAGTASSGFAGDAYWEEGPEVDITKSIVSMDGGHEIFMDKTNPEDRDDAGKVVWEEGEVDFRSRIVWEETDID